MHGIIDMHKYDINGLIVIIAFIIYLVAIFFCQGQITLSIPEDILFKCLDEWATSLPKEICLEEDLVHLIHCGKKLIDEYVVAVIIIFHLSFGKGPFLFYVLILWSHAMVNDGGDDREWSGVHWNYVLV